MGPVYCILEQGMLVLLLKLVCVPPMFVVRALFATCTAVQIADAALITGVWIKTCVFFTLR